MFHQKNGEYIKRGEIIGLPGVPEYIPASNEIVEFSSKDDFYQIKVRDERTGKVVLSSVKMASSFFFRKCCTILLMTFFFYIYSVKWLQVIGMMSLF